MSVESSLQYQQDFFEHFNQAWQDKSSYQLYRGLDTTADNLRLPIEEAPGYILAYDKNAQQELQDFLQTRFIAFVREHIPFFEVSDDGRVFFGDWYHRRQFGELKPVSRTIAQYTDEEQAIIPQLQAFSQDPDNYLQLELEAMRKDVYRDVNRLQNQLETEMATQSEPQEAANGGFRGLLKTFIDPSDPDESQPSAPATPDKTKRLRQQFNQVKDQADHDFDAKKRQLEVSAAITRYEYQAVLSEYSSIEQFENVLSNLKTDFMAALKAEGGKQNA